MICFFYTTTTSAKQSSLSSIHQWYDVIDKIMDSYISLKTRYICSALHWSLFFHAFRFFFHSLLRVLYIWILWIFTVCASFFSYFTQCCRKAVTFILMLYSGNIHQVLNHHLTYTESRKSEKRFQWRRIIKPWPWHCQLSLIPALLDWAWIHLFITVQPWKRLEIEHETMCESACV